MPRLPQRHTLASQIIELLRESIADGTWHDTLPGERKLCESYQISRHTLRAALVQLQRDGLIRAVHGSGNKIVGQPKRKANQRPSHDVGLLSPEPLERLRPMQTLWIDDLRAMLGERGCQLHIFTADNIFAPNPAQL